MRGLYAAAITERLLPAYVSFSHKTGRGNPHLLTEILECLSRDIDGIKMDPEELQQNIDLSMDLAAYAKNFDAEHGTKLFDALLKNGFPAP